MDGYHSDSAGHGPIGAKRTCLSTVLPSAKQTPESFQQITTLEVKLLLESIFSDSEGNVLHGQFSDFQIIKPDSSVCLTDGLSGLGFQPHPD